MLTCSRVARTTIAAFSCAFALAACGGGGGGGTSGAGPVPVPTATPAAITQAQARATMQSSLKMVQDVNGVSISGSGTLAIARRVQAIHHGRRVQSTTTCSNGYSSTIVTHADGSLTETDNTYYDALCTLIEETDVINFPASATLQNLTATGTITTYARSGAVTSYGTFTVALTGGTQDTITILVSVAATVGGTPYAKLGATCVGPSTSASLHCGLATVVTASGQQDGVSLDEAVSYVTNGTTSTGTETATASAYLAASGLDIAAGPSPAWTVTGAAPIETVTGSVTIVFTNSGTTSGTIALSDTTHAVSIAGTVTASTVTITASANGNTVATVTLDHSGNGTITYAGGTTATVTGWLITG
jgi:hypothetical protein